MIFRVVAVVLFLAIGAVGIMLSGSDAPTAQVQAAPAAAQQAPQATEDSSLKGFKIP